MTPEQGLLDLEAVHRKELKAGWEFIRKLTLFVSAWGPGYIYQVADHMNMQPKTLQNYVSLARNPVSPYAESLGLSRQHAAAVAGLPEEEAKSLLLRAAEEGLADDWLRYEARARKLPPTGKEGTVDERTYHAEVRSTLTAIDAGGTQHRRDGADPHYGVEVASADCDDVPFALPPDPEMEEGDTPFDVAERLVVRCGVAFAREVAAEITRWSEWRNE